MGNSNLVKFTALSQNHGGKRTHVIDTFTPHCVVGQASAERFGTMFPSSRADKASCNYGIATDGRVVLVVDEDNKSNCSSSSANDQRAVTVECASDSTHPYAFNDVVYNKLIELCVDVCKRNGKTKAIWIADKNTALAYEPKTDEILITVHRWFAAKACPGEWLFSRLGDFATEVTRRLNDEVASAPTPMPTPVEPRLLSKGCKGDDVRELQTNLNKVIGAGLSVDGDFGSATDKAVRTFQQKYGLSVDGIYGANSRAKMREALNSPTPTPTPTYSKTDFIKDVQRCTGSKVDGIAGNETISKTITISIKLNSRHQVVKYIQKYLNVLGYNAGTEDGIFGSNTESAVKRYQANVVYGGATKYADGIITANNKTWKKLLGMI